ncbi:PREDICTED: pentatricopeptide repeat-containing protein At3g56030-like [Camelina sativa]|uniref:Pentatricopeptide repeat-containing protein At3g56030-like n=1 Tax=Camelina sativa TaxID=90675 RepID=A0ABM0TJQ6_CAMSA|nr:PREDICTED: pentatricopeptide repeat-containing protein At3g56030-like [Camelina sativa]
MSLLRRFVRESINSRFLLQSISGRSISTVNPNPIGHPGHRRTTAEFDNLIFEAGSSGDFEAVRRLLNTRVVNACFNTTATFKFLTNTESYSSSLEDLRRVLPQTDAGYTRKHAYETLIARLCKLNRIDDALILIKDMAIGNFELSTSTFHPILNTLTKKNKIEEAWRVVKLMRSHGVPMDVTSYNYFLTSHCYDGDVAEASKVLRKMEEDEEGKVISPDTRTYDALVLGACKSGKVEAAMAILRRMEEEGLPVLYATHAHVIGVMVESGYYALSVEFVMAYAGKDKRLDEENLGSLASKLIKRKRFNEAKLVLKEMSVRGLRMGDALRDFYQTNVLKS